MQKIILECVVGSTVHGTAVDDGLEDLDLMAVVIDEPEQVFGFDQREAWGLGGKADAWVTRTKPEGVRSEAGDTDHVAYGLRKFLSLALKGNPSILLALFAPFAHVRACTPEGAALRGFTGSIISKSCYPHYRGYMLQQHQRLIGTRGQKNVTRPELVEAYGYDTKYAGHIVRLGYQGVELLRTGNISLPMPQAQRDVVIAVRTGKYKLEDVSVMLAEAEIELTRAYRESPLPDLPDFGKIEKWMIETYLHHWSKPVAPHAAWPFDR